MDLHVRNRVNLKRDVSGRVSVLHDDIDRNEGHVHPVNAFEDGNAEGPHARLYDAIPEFDTVFGPVALAAED